MAALAAKNGIEPHAGHGLTYDNVQPIAAIPQLAELNIGHYLVGEAVFVGLEEAVRRMRELMDAARMIIGMGSDLCNIERIQAALERHGERFEKRCFTEIERAKAARRPFTRAGTYAKRFAAKEAFSKAVGTGFFQGVYMKDIGVVNLPSGAPTLALENGAASGCFTAVERAKAAQRPFTAPDLRQALRRQGGVLEGGRTGFFRGRYMKDIGVVNLPSGAPTLKLENGAAKRGSPTLTPAGHEAHVHLTLTDDHPWAQAFVVIEARPK